MLMNPPKWKKCKICAHCRQLYRRRWFAFMRFPSLYCTERRALTEGENFCDKWQKRKAEIDLSSERFEKAEQGAAAVSEKIEELGWK